MGIKEILAEQDAPYISLRQLLTDIAASDGCSLGEAATVLNRLLATKRDAPTWASYTKANGILMAPANNKARDCLLYVVNNGKFYDFDDDDIPF